MNKRSCCLICLVVVGIVLMVAGIVFIPVSKNIIHKQIENQVNLKSKQTQDNWVKNPTPIYFQLWVWNIDNPDEVRAGKKPALSQRGPYTYVENRQKVDIKWHDNNNTVTYRELKYYTFDREMSVGNETDNFTTVNIPYMTIANIMKREFGFLQIFANILAEWAHEDLFPTLTVGQLIWGYDEPLVNKTLTLIEAILGKKLNISDKFGVFSGTNGTDDGVYNVKTGVGDTSQFGMIKSWNYLELLPYWTSKTCNMVNGTDGTIFHPFVEEKDVFYVYSSDLCRSIYFTYLNRKEHQDIKVYRFTTPPDVFMNRTDNPANEGFCTPADNCLASGLLNVENCRDGAPIIFSQPHFLNADPAIQNAVVGMHPNEEEHATFIDIEPNTGAAFFAAKKLQVNLQLQKIDNFKETEHLEHVVIPLLWLNESSIITKSLADEFKSALQTPLEAIHAGIIVAISLGAVLVLAAVLVIVIGKIRQNMNYRQMENVAD